MIVGRYGVYYCYYLLLSSSLLLSSFLFSYHCILVVVILIINNHDAEVDLLLGTYASENVLKMDKNELDQFEDFVNMETIDIYNVITLRLDVPDEMKTKNGDGVVERIQEWARSNPLGKADPEQYKAIKTEHKLI